MSVEFEIRKCSFDETIRILNCTRDEFVPQIESESDYLRYAQKLSTYADFILAKSEGAYMGVIAAYFNQLSKIAYISHFAVFKEYRNEHIGHLLMEKCCEETNRELGVFSEVHLEVLKENVRAITFYTKENFHIVSESINKIQLSKEITKWNKEKI